MTLRLRPSGEGLVNEKSEEKNGSGAVRSSFRDKKRGQAHSRAAGFFITERIRDWDGALSLHDVLEFPEEFKSISEVFFRLPDQSGQQPNREQRQLPYGAQGSI